MGLKYTNISQEISKRNQTLCSEPQEATKKTNLSLQVYRPLFLPSDVRQGDGGRHRIHVKEGVQELTVLFYMEINFF